MAGFGDDFGIGNQSEVGNTLERVLNLPEINDIIDSHGGMDQVIPEADKSPSCQVLCNQRY